MLLFESRNGSFSYRSGLFISNLHVIAHLATRMLGRPGNMPARAASGLFKIAHFRDIPHVFHVRGFHPRLIGSLIHDS
jgi:hypothetical protein